MLAVFIKSLMNFDLFHSWKRQINCIISLGKYVELDDIALNNIILNIQREMKSRFMHLLIFYI